MYQDQLLNGKKGKVKTLYYDASPADIEITSEEESSYPGLIKDGEDKKAEKQQRITSIKRHVRFDDYFGTLATVIDLIRQNNERNIAEIDKYNQALKRITDDLMFLQHNYKIEKKQSK